jgi:dihydrofolate reductase
MGRIVVTEFVSIDGVMEEPRWTFDFERGPEGDKFKYDELFEAGALLLGRITYQGFGAAWPSMGGDQFGQRMNEIPKYVVSSSLSDDDATWGPTTVLRGDAATEIEQLRRDFDGNLLVEGSAQLVHTLAQHGLVDEYRLMVFPVILGAGKRAFPDHTPEPAKLTVASSATLDSGVQILTLHPA